MKKLMIAAAAAAMASGAFAITQVYEMRLNLKSTECKSATLTANQNPFVPAGGMVSYRDVTTVTIAGLIWSCDCEYIQDLGMENYGWALDAASLLGNNGTGAAVNAGGTRPVQAVGNANLFRMYTWANTQNYNGVAAPGNKQTAQSGSEGYVFWNTKTGEPFGYAPITKPTAAVNTWWIPDTGVGPEFEPMPTFFWWFLQRIGMRAEKVEGTWELVDWYSTQNKYDLIGSGFGQARVGSVGLTAAQAAYNAQALAAFNGLNECGEAIITQMSGNVAGSATNVGGNGGCVFCGLIQCTAYPFCNCDLAAGPSVPVSAQSAVYGTWTLRYNASLSNRLLGFSSVRSIYNFPTAVADMVEFLEFWAIR